MPKQQNMCISVEEMYQIYLQKVNLTEENMHPTERKQRRQTFFCCAGIFMMMMLQVPEMPEEKQLECLESIDTEITNFWKDLI